MVFSFRIFSKLSILLIAFSFFSIYSEARVLHKDLGKPGYKPEWTDKTIMDQGVYIYSVGRSQAKTSEKEAKDEALSNATESFVKYCRVDIQSFDRSIEVYSKNKKGESTASDVSSQSIIRTKTFVTRAVPESWYTEKDGARFIAYVLLKIPKEEFDRITGEKNIKLSMDVLFYYEDYNGKMQVLSEGSVLSSKDSFAIYIRPSDTCYLYIYQIDSLGKSFRLFPNTDYKTASNPIEPAVDCWIPNNKNLFELDETTGKEYFYIFASIQPIAEFEGKDSVTLNKKDIDGIIEIKKMGVAGIKAKRNTEQINVPKYTKEFAEVKNKLQAEGVFVYETWFWHK